MYKRETRWALALVTMANAQEPSGSPSPGGVGGAVTALDLFNSFSSLGSLDPFPDFSLNPLTFVNHRRQAGLVPASRSIAEEALVSEGVSKGGGL